MVHLLESLPDSYMLVTAFEANAEVPKIEIVTKCLLHEESKPKDRVALGIESETKAMTGQHRWKGKGPKRHHCGHFGHIRRTCRELTSRTNDSNKKRIGKQNIKHTMNR